MPQPSPRSPEIIVSNSEQEAVQFRFNNPKAELPVHLKGINVQRDFDFSTPGKHCGFGRQVFLYLGLESMRLGHGGDATLSRLTGVNVKTIALGVDSCRRGTLRPSVSAQWEAVVLPLKKTT